MLACWGSFLNVVGYRLVRSQSVMWPRSACPHCNHTLPWYDLIPLFSWLLLRGKCRFCNNPISIFYPCIELITILSITALYISVPIHYFPAYFIFFSALIVTIRSDLETMLISRLVTIFLVPLALALSITYYLPISPLESLCGILLGYLFLRCIATLFYCIAKREGIGQGDIELLAFIGSFIGPLGVWISLLCGSIIGSIVGVLYLGLTKQSTSTKIPFGPFLAFGAMAYVLYQEQIAFLLLGSM